VLHNVLSNSYKYTETGSITCKVTLQAQPERDDENLYCFTIRDTGCGINANQITSIFDPFTRYSSLTDGSGLGLTIVRDFVTNMGGNVDVSSTLGSGTVFVINLPLMCATAASDDPLVLLFGTDLDDLSTQEIASSRAHYTVPNSAEQLLSAARRRGDLILLSINETTPDIIQVLRAQCISCPILTFATNIEPNSAASQTLLELGASEVVKTKRGGTLLADRTIFWLEQI